MSGNEGDGWDGLSEIGTVAPRVEAEGERMLGDMVAGAAPFSPKRRSRGKMRRSAGDSSSDESEVSVDGSRRRRAGETPTEVVAATLEMRALAAEWSSGIRARTYATLKRGRFAQGGPDREPEHDQLVFKPNSVVTITELDTAGGLYDRLRKGTVVATVIGKTGLGKSTRFSGMIARKVGCRVLQISPDVTLKDKHAASLEELVHVSPFWSPEKKPLVTVMTPEEFCGRFFVDGWAEMVDMFDVVVLDEAHTPTKWYGGVKAAVTSKVKAGLSLLMLTATAAGQVDMQSATKTPKFVPRRLEDIVNAEDFIDSEYAVDRMMFIVESDERLQAVVKGLSGSGCVVYSLESGASTDAVSRVHRALEGDSPAIRILVAHSRFGVSYNLPVAKVATTGLRRFIAETSTGGFMYKAEPLSMAEIKQHLGRADRGIVQNAHQGVVFLEESMVSPQVELVESEKFGFYILLVAMGIRPGKRLSDAVAHILPHGISRRVAVAIMGVYGLPPEVVVRFLGPDGAFPYAYSRALRQFSVVSTTPMVSKHEEPLGFEDWQEVKAFSVIKRYQDSTTLGPTIRVPFVADGELMPLLVFVCAVAQSVFVPEVPPSRRDDGYTSGPEREERRVRRWESIAYRPAPLEIVPVEYLEVEESEPRRFALDVPVEEQPAFRRRGYPVFPSPITDAFKVATEGPSVQTVVDGKGRRWIKLVDDNASGSPVDVEGNEVSLQFPKPLWEQLQRGELLNMNNFKMFLKLVKDHASVLASSAVFANWGDPWLSVTSSFCEEEYIHLCKVKGLSSHVLTFLGLLWQRYIAGMKRAVDASHQSKSYWRKLVTKFSMSRAFAPPIVEEGDVVEVAQSNEFLQRLYQIRLNIALVISAFEQSGLFSPEAVSQMQRVLPVSKRLGDSVYDAVRTGKATRRKVKRIGDGAVDRGDPYGGTELTDDFDGAKPRLLNRLGEGGNAWY